MERKLQGIPESTLPFSSEGIERLCPSLPHLLGRAGRGTLAWALVLTFLPAPALALSLDVTIDTKRAHPDDGFQVTVQLEAEEGVELKRGATSDFDVSQNASSCGTSISCVGASCTSSRSCTLGFRFAPLREGKLTIPSFSLEGPGGKVLASSNPLEVEVTKSAKRGGTGGTARGQGGGVGGLGGGGGGMGRQRGSRGGGISVQGQGGGGKVFGESDKSYSASDVRDAAKFSDHDLFILPVMNRGSAYLNEPVRVDFVLYINPRGDLPYRELSVSSARVQLPDMRGFRKEDIEMEVTQGQVELSGKVFKTALLASYVLFPLEQGAGTLAQAKASVPAVVLAYDPFWGQVPRHDIVEVFSPQVALPVKPVPQPRPAGFDDANVGAFRIRGVEVSPAQEAGSWMMVKYSIEGSGNLLSLKVPELPASPDIEQREPHVDRTAVTRTAAGVEGRIDVQVPFRAKRPGSFHLGEIVLEYFDPSTGQFGRASWLIPEVVATEVKAEPGEQAHVAQDQILGVVADGSLLPAEAGDGVLRPHWMLAWAVGVPLLWMIAVLVRLAARMAGRDTARRREKNAVAQARKELDDAQRFLAAGQTDRFFAALLHAIGIYLEARFGISVGSATYDVLGSRLAALGAPEGLVEALRKEMESAEFGRYAPSRLQGQDMGEALGRTREILSGLDRVRSARRSG